MTRLALQGDHIESIIHLAIQKENHLLVPIVVVVVILLVLLSSWSSHRKPVSFHVAVDSGAERFQASLVLGVQLDRLQIRLVRRPLIVGVVCLPVRCPHQPASKVPEAPKRNINDDKNGEVVGGAVAGNHH